MAGAAPCVADLLAALDRSALAATAAYPGIRNIDALNCLLSLLAGK